jgi:hypothetical protein
MEEEWIAPVPASESSIFVVVVASGDCINRIRKYMLAMGVKLNTSKNRARKRAVVMEDVLTIRIKQGTYRKSITSL